MPIETILEWLFWVSLFAVAYSYALYPLVLTLWSSALGEAPRVAKATLPQPVDVACVVSAYNEERHVVARVRNFLAQRYKGGSLRVYIGSDGSEDATPRLLAEVASDQVIAFPFELNRGKSSVLNDLVSASREPIMVFSDANTMFEPDAIERLVSHFDDPEVGAVSGELRLLDSRGDNQDSVYWRIEQYLKRREAMIGGLLGANGGIYAIRRELYRALPPDTIIDDFCIAMNVVVQGKRLVYDPTAIAIEDTPDNIQDEYKRRIRIGIGNFQAFFRHPEYFLRTNWATRFTYVSHKVLRWFTPHLLGVALICSWWLARSSGFFLLLACLQSALYVAALLRQWTGASFALPRPVNLLVFFLTLNWAFMVAFWRYVTGRYSGSWRRTERT